MACSNCKNTSNSCTCKDTPLTTMPTYSCPPDVRCPDPTPCFETIQDTCVKHNLNYKIINFGQNVGAQGMVLNPSASLETVYQMWSTDPNTWSELCLPPFNVHPSYIGQTAIIISWEDTGADTYNLEVSSNEGISWSMVSALIEPTYTFSLLTPNTEYYFRVTSVCDSSPIQPISAIISVTTKA
jgi:hypothetical protein